MTTFGCIRAKMGDTTYYICKMTAGDLVNRVSIASELPEWPDVTPEEKLNLNVDLRYVVEKLVPYLIENKNRFFSGFVVDIFSGFDEIQFVPLSEELGESKSVIVSSLVKDIGFLHMPGKEQFVALDGQQRLLALRIAINGVAGIPGNTRLTGGAKYLKPHPELIDEELSVILIEHTDMDKFRTMYNTLNRHNGRVRNNNRVVSDYEDVFAILTRRLLDDGEPFASVNGTCPVNLKSTTLAKRSKNLTSLAALRDITEIILGDTDSSVSKNNEEIDGAYHAVSNFWRTLFQGMDAYKQYFELLKSKKTIAQLRAESLLLKSTTQFVLAHVYLLAQQKGVSWEAVVENLNKIDWSFSNKLWKNILVSNRKMLFSNDAIQNASLVVSSLVMKEYLTNEELDNVAQIIQDAK